MSQISAVMDKLPERHGFPWVQNEVDHLEALYASGNTIRFIALVHQRTERAIKFALEKIAAWGSTMSKWPRRGQY